MKEKVTVRVSEEVECFKDCWNYDNETHYTEEWVEEQDNYYDIEVDMDEDGNILEDTKAIEAKIKNIIEGNLIDYEVLY